MPVKRRYRNINRSNRKVKKSNRRRTKNRSYRKNNRKSVRRIRGGATRRTTATRAAAAKLAKFIGNARRSCIGTNCVATNEQGGTGQLPNSGQFSNSGQFPNSGQFSNSGQFPNSGLCAKVKESWQNHSPAIVNALNLTEGDIIVDVDVAVDNDTHNKNEWKWGKSLDSNRDTQMGIFPSDKIIMIDENEQRCTDTKQFIGESIKEELTDNTNRIADFTHKATSGYRFHPH